MSNLPKIRQLRADIARQRAEIAEQAHALAARDAELATQESELDITERWNTRFEEGNAASPANGNGAHVAKKGKKKRQKMTQTDLVLDTLRARDGHAANDLDDLLAAIQAKHGITVKKTSLQPLISQMKDETIVRDGSKIVLKPGV